MGQVVKMVGLYVLVKETVRAKKANKKMWFRELHSFADGNFFDTTNLPALPHPYPFQGRLLPFKVKWWLQECGESICKIAHRR